MDFYDVVNSRRSIRQFQDKPIPRDVLERILDAGLKAPSSNHQRQWELMVLTDKARIEALADLISPYPYRAREAKSPQQDMFRVAFPRQHSMVAEAACVILPSFRQKYAFEDPKNEYGLWDYGAAWALVENMLLAATAEGLGVGVHVPVKKERVAIDELITPKAGYFLPTLVVMGYASADAETPRQVEATVAKKVHWNAW